MLPNKTKILNNILNKNDEPLLDIATVVTVSPYTIKFPPDTTAIPAIATTSLYNISVGSRVTVLRFNKQYIITGVLGDPANKYKDYVIKQSDETRNNTTTVSTDNELTITLPSNGIYEIEARLFVDATSNTPDLKMSWYNSNVTQLTYRNCLGHGTNTTSVYNSDFMHFHSRSMGTETTYGLVSSGWASIWEVWIVETGSSEGVITLEWAQNTATAEDITMKANSYLGYTRLDSFPYAGSGSLADIESDIDDLQADVADNTTDIAANTSGIATNASNISTNTSNISTNTSDISDNASDISDLQNNKQNNIILVKKTSDESVTSSTTMQNDNHLYIDINTDGIYQIDLYLAYNGAQSGDILVDWSVTNGVSQYTQRHCNGVAQSSTSGYDTTKKSRTYNLSDDVTYGAASTSYETIVQESFIVQKSGTNGRLQLRWCQDTPDGTATTVTTDSWLRVTKVTTGTSI